jgi:hypothetical protein
LAARTGFEGSCTEAARSTKYFELGLLLSIYKGIFVPTPLFVRVYTGFGKIFYLVCIWGMSEILLFS